jgi:hypothetical protein
VAVTSSIVHRPLPWRRFATAAVTGGLAVAGLIVALNVPPLGAGVFGLGVGSAALLPMRSARIGALIIGTLMGVMLGLQLALAYQPNVALIIGALAGAAVVGSSAWRQATAPEATAADRAVTLVVSRPFPSAAHARGHRLRGWPLLRSGPARGVSALGPTPRNRAQAHKKGESP